MRIELRAQGLQLGTGRGQLLLLQPPLDMGDERERAVNEHAPDELPDGALAHEIDNRGLGADEVHKAAEANGPYRAERESRQHMRCESAAGGSGIASPHQDVPNRPAE